MNIKVQQKELKVALAEVSRAAPAKSTLPILETILFSAEGDWLTLSATNLEISISKRIPAEVNKAGQVAAPAKTIYKFVSALPDGKVLVTEKDSKIVLKSEKSSASFPIMPADEFPPMPAFDTGGEVVEALSLLDAIRHTVFVASADDVRPVLQGCFIGNGVMAATDGFRLAVHPVTWIPKTPLIIPAKSLAEISRSLVDKEVKVRFEEAGIIFQGDDWLIKSALIAGTFPDYKMIIPRDLEKIAKIQSKLLIAGLKQIKAIPSDYPSVLLTFSTNRLILSQDGDEGAAEVEVPCEFTGEMSIRLNLDFFMAACEHAGEIVEMRMTGPKAPVDLVNGGYHHVIMPMAQ